MNYELRNNYVPMNLKPDDQSVIFNLNKDGLVMSRQTCVKPNGGIIYPHDARTKDGARGIETVLDTPAMVGFDGPVSQTFYINNKKYKDSYYKNYSEIQNGQITYYVDESVAQPFFNPVYALSSYVDKAIFVDPMGSHYPEYRKTPVTSSFNNMPYDQKTKDEIFYREDLMSRQQGGHLKSNWTARFIN